MTKTSYFYIFRLNYSLPVKSWESRRHNQSKKRRAKKIRNSKTFFGSFSLIVSEHHSLIIYFAKFESTQNCQYKKWLLKLYSLIGPYHVPIHGFMGNCWLVKRELLKTGHLNNNRLYIKTRYYLLCKQSLYL